MNRFIAIVLLICFHAQPAMVVSVWADYVINNDFIKEVLCINKEKPKLECNGKCYLATKLKEESQKKDSEEKMLFGEATNVLVFFVSIEEMTFNFHVISSAVKHFFYLNNYRSFSLSKRDRPPIFA